MSFMSRVKSLFGAGGADKAAGNLLASILQQGLAPRRGTKELIDAYRTSPWLRAVVHRIASEVASVRLELYQSTKPKSGEAKAGRRRVRAMMHRTKGATISYSPMASEELEAHPFLDLIDSPNPAMTRSLFTYVCQAYLDLKGEVFLVVERNPDGSPKQLWVIPPHWCLAIPTAPAPQYRFSYMSWQRLIPEDDVLYMRHPDLLNPYARGVGAAESASDELDIDEYCTRHLKSWFFNRASPDVFVSIEGVKTTQQAIEYQEKLRQKYGGTGKGNQIHITSGKVDVKQLGHTFREQQLPELRQQERDFLLQLFSMPPEVMGIIENSNRSTIDAAYYLLMKGVVVPRLTFFADHFTDWARREYDDPSLSAGFDSPVPEDQVFRKDVMVAQPTAFSLNEWRELAGMEPRPGWDDVFPEKVQPLLSPGGAQPALPSGDEPPEDDDLEEDDEEQGGPPEQVPEGDDVEPKGLPPEIRRSLPQGAFAYRGR